MDVIHSEFVNKTSADPGLARDLLESHNWDLDSAVKSYNMLNGDHQRIENENKVKPENDSKNGSGDCPTILHQRAPLERDDSIEDVMFATKKLSRGISRATDNVGLVSKARSELTLSHVLVDTPIYTFTLPDLSVYPPDFREFLKKDLIENSTLTSLEQSGRLNWWVSVCQRLWPLATSGDGNCLLHAASLGMWGFHDRLLTLRKALHSLLTKSSFTEGFYRRWRWHTMLQNKEAGLVYSEEEWEKEWEALLRMSSTEPRCSSLNRRSKGDSEGAAGGGVGPTYLESLEEIHVLALAHVLRRPIVVIADTMLKDVTGEPFAPIAFGGVYLPYECTPESCHKSPLCLAYDAAHFSALVPMEQAIPQDEGPRLPAIPLTDSSYQLLNLPFCTDPGPDVRWGKDEKDPAFANRVTLSRRQRLALLNSYLEVIELRPDSPPPQSVTSSGSESTANAGSSTSGASVTTSIANRAARQLHHVAKQFGSLGRTMSRRIKKNFSRGSFRITSKRTPKESREVVESTEVESSEYDATEEGGMIAAILHTDERHEYQEEMVRNYLLSARTRFAALTGTPEPTLCALPHCTMFGSAETEGLCSVCYYKKVQERAKSGGKVSPPCKTADNALYSKAAAVDTAMTQLSLHN